MSVSLRKRWRAGEVTRGVGVTIPGPTVVQLLARAGFDWLMIDMEHGPISMESAHGMIAATAGTQVAPIVRLGHTLPWLAKPVLDAGATGVVFPAVGDRADAEAAARAVRYPPAGDRMWGPFYAAPRSGRSIPAYVASANDETASIAIVETPGGVAAIEEIVSVEGLDAVVIGTHDLAVSMGRPEALEDPDVRAAVARVEQAVLASPVALGGNAFSAEQADRMVDRGYQVITLGFDWSLLQRGAADVLAPPHVPGRG